MQPLAIRIRATRKRFVAENESEVQSAITIAEQEADRAGVMGLVDFEAANGNTLTLLVGGADSALSWRYAGDRDPRFVSRGEPDAEGTVTCSRDPGSKIEVPRTSLIGRGDALAALNEFTASNEIPEGVMWVDYVG